MTTTESELKTREFVLPHDLNEYVEDVLVRKQFTSVDNLVIAALYHFRDFAEAARIKHERLKADIQSGIDQLDLGEGIDGEEFFARMERELQEAEKDAA